MTPPAITPACGRGFAVEALQASRLEETVRRAQRHEAMARPPYSGARTSGMSSPHAVSSPVS